MTRTLALLLPLWSLSPATPFAMAQTVHPLQAGLAEALENARPLEVEALMKGPESVWDQFNFRAPNRTS